MAPSPIDTELIATLERAFAQHSGGDTKIDVSRLKAALGLQSDYLAQRVLSAFDENGDGVISKDEFLGGVRELVLGSDRDKLAFAFRLHDHDGDGFLDAEELHRMIAISLAESDVSERVTQPSNYLAAQILRSADANRDGRLSLDELEAAVRKYPDLLTQMTRSEAIWIAPNEELLLAIDERAKKKKKSPGRVLENRKLEAVFIALWIAGNVGVLTYTLTFGRTHVTADPAMEMGRALGACLDFNGGLVLIPMMRRLLTRVRASFLGRIVPVDESIAFHKLVGHTLFALAVAHSAAFVLAYASGHVRAAPWEIFATGRGLTGGILLGVFVVMWIFSLGFVRRSQKFELFYFTHLLYMAWLALSVVHAPRILMFSGVPIVGFVVEQLLRVRRRGPPSRVVSTWPLRSGVTRLEIERPPGFTFDAGDYVFVRIPAIARHEWHPFTISSAPEQPNLVLHVRSLGNWTSALRRHVERKGKDDSLFAYVDGPYGSPSAHIFASRFAVLIGAGIGVTPFASVLESVVLRESGRAPSSLEKVHFFWLNRDQYSFEWFRGLLSRLEEHDAKRRLDIHLCMTGARTGVTALGLELARAIMHASGRTDIVTGLRTHTHIGHPDWAVMLERIAEEHRPAKVDVFFCGPPGLARKLEPICHGLGMSFREERF